MTTVQAYSYYNNCHAYFLFSNETHTLAHIRSKRYHQYVMSPMLPIVVIPSHIILYPLYSCGDGRWRRTCSPAFSNLKHTHTKITQLHCKYLKSTFYANLTYTIFNGPYKAKFHCKKWFKVQTKYAPHLCVYHTLKTLKNSVTWFPLICRIHSHFLSVYSEHIRESCFFLIKYQSQTECHSFCYTGKKIHTLHSGWGTKRGT